MRASCTTLIGAHEDRHASRRLHAVDEYFPEMHARTRLKTWSAQRRLRGIAGGTSGFSIASACGNNRDKFTPVFFRSEPNPKKSKRFRRPGRGVGSRILSGGSLMYSGRSD